MNLSMMQVLTANRLSISDKLVLSLSIDSANLLSTFSSLLKKIFVKPKEVAAMALPAERISGSGISTALTPSVY
jgi:hypothetical protein